MIQEMIMQHHEMIVNNIQNVIRGYQNLPKPWTLRLHQRSFGTQIELWQKSNQDYSKDFTWHEGTWVFKWHEIMEGLSFNPEPYAPIPVRDKNGYPFWKRVVQYNACYLSSDGDIED